MKLKKDRAAAKRPSKTSNKTTGKTTKRKGS
jgi:hypothetical protein